jgi:hypothetical protein
VAATIEQMEQTWLDQHQLLDATLQLTRCRLHGHGAAKGMADRTDVACRIRHGQSDEVGKVIN